MESQGSTSFDSLSSSDSLLFSDSEQAEDDTDVFLTDSSSSAIISGTAGAMTDGDGGSGSPASQWTSDGFTEKEEEEEGYKSEMINKESQIGLDEREPTSQTPKSQGDLLFAQKCAELQGFVRPLLELLNGLKKGRFDRGLSSFQQSVAMDRIQRIVGILQRPNSGEKYLSTLLQVEAMLKLWFPQIPTLPVSAASSVATSPARSLNNTAGSTPPHKHRDQLHIPVKKRRLSWTGTDSPTPSPVHLKSPRINTEEEMSFRHGAICPSLASSDQNSPDMAAAYTEEQSKPSKYKSQSSEPSLTWVHVAPILSPRKSSSSTVALNSETQSVTNGPSSNQDSPAMQDSSISSTTNNKNQKNSTKLARCQSQPCAGQPNDIDRETHQGQSYHIESKLFPDHVPPP